MTSPFRHIARLLTATVATAMMAAAMTGCYQAEYHLVEPSSPEDAYIQISVVAGTDGAPQSRAEGDFSYEPGAGNENFRTLRIIIVNMDERKVEHNITLQSSPDPAYSLSTNPYLVKAESQKKILLIGNESSLPQALRQTFQNLSRGQAFDTDLLTSIIQYPTGTIADNGGTEGSGGTEGTGGTTTDGPAASQPFFPSAEDQLPLIPITETYDIYVGEPKIDETTGEQIPYTATLFATRVATKFDFTLTVDPAYTANNIAPAAITISPIATSQYLFPQNTLYNPAKSSSTLLNPIEINDSEVKREITQYEVPNDETVTTTFTARGWSDGKIIENDSTKYTLSSVYLSETGTGTYTAGTSQEQVYTITLHIDGREFTADLPNLPSLPRNTYVKVDMKLSGPKLDAKVTVLPYTGVWLNPGFGINRPPKEPETPEPPETPETDE